MRHSTWIGGITGALLAVSVSAQDLGFRVTAQATHSDNLQRGEPGTELDDTIASLELAFGALKDSGPLTYDFNGQYRYLEYLQDTFRAEPVLALDLDSTWVILPNRLEWVLQDNYGQLTADALEANNPGNREDSNILTTGPTFTFRFGSQLNAIVRARYVDQYFETTNADNNRISTELELQRMLGVDRSISLIGINDALDFDDNALTDFDRRAVFLRYQTLVAGNTFTVDAGVNEVDDGFVTSDGTLYRISLERATSALMSYRLDVSQSYSDSGLRLASSNGGLGSIGGAQDTIANGTPLELQTASLVVSRTAGRSVLNVTADYTQERFLEITGQDRDVTGITADFEYALTPFSAAGIQATFQTVGFGDLDRDDDDFDYGVYYRRQFGRSISAVVSITDSQRRSSQIGRDYDELRASINFSYSRGRLFEGQ